MAKRPPVKRASKADHQLGDAILDVLRRHGYKGAMASPQDRTISLPFDSMQMLMQKAGHPVSLEPDPKYDCLIVGWNAESIRIGASDDKDLEQLIACYDRDPMDVIAIQVEPWGKPGKILKRYVLNNGKFVEKL